MGSNTMARLLLAVMDPFAELVVAYREDRQLQYISRKALLVFLGCLAFTIWFIAMVVVGPAPAHADPGCYDSGSPDCGGHTWNGPLRQTWDAPGYYGGQSGGNTLLCNPFDYTCAGVSEDTP